MRKKDELGRAEQKSNKSLAFLKIPICKFLNHLRLIVKAGIGYNGFYIRSCLRKRCADGVSAHTVPKQDKRRAIVKMPDGSCKILSGTRKSKEYPLIFPVSRIIKEDRSVSGFRKIPGLRNIIV